MNTPLSFFRTLQLYSVDVAIGAVSSAYFFYYYVFNSILPLIHALVLFSAVTSIYTFDHIFDVLRIDSHFISSRRLTHQKNLRFLKIACVFNSLIAAIGCLFLNEHVIYSGIGISIGMLLYYGLLWKLNLSYLKDIAVSLGYALGILIPVLSYDFRLFNIDFLLFGLIFFFNTLFIMVLYAIFDSKLDKQEHIEGLSKKFSPKALRYFLISLSSFQLILICFAIYHHAPFKFVGLMITQNLLILLFAKSKRLDSSTVRFFGEWSYAIYFLILLF